MSLASLPVENQSPEWRQRLELAACYRLLAHYKMTDLIYTHATVRVPGEPGHFLINPYGHRWEEITASSLVKIDVDGDQDRRQPAPRESRGIHHPQRRPHGEARRRLRHPHPHARGHGGFGGERRLAADQPDRSAILWPPRHPRLRGNRARSRRAPAHHPRLGRFLRRDLAQPWPADGRTDGRRSLQPDVLL